MHVRNAIDESEGFGWSGNAEAAPVAGVGEVRDSNLLFQWSSSSEMMPIEPLWRYLAFPASESLCTFEISKYRVPVPPCDRNNP